MAAPRTQYDRNLTIRVVGGGPLVSFTFPIKPKEFQRDTPARVTTTQTLQGVYQDMGGLGVESLVYQGNTGWRARSPSAPLDGFGVFQSLYQNVYLEYHKRIQDALDPNAVQCLVIDDLYETVYQVSLDDFQATKSVSETLLYNYVLRMTVKTTSLDTRDPVDYVGLPLLANGVNQIARQVSTAINTVYQYQTQQQRTYAVQSGDSLWSIAFKYTGDGTRDSELAKVNGIQPPYTIITGQILNIPSWW